MRYRFVTCDVFTDVRFGGNQLAVFPRATGLTDGQMQQIAREFNLAETTFVFPPEAGQTRKVRIFTPACEVPFAGHPNIGTAAMLAAHGELGDVDQSLSVVFEEEAGLVPISIARRPGDRFHCELQAPAPLTLGPEVPAAAVAAAATLTEADVVTTTHPPRAGSVGLGFLLTEVRDPATLARAKPNVAALERLAREFDQPYLHLYTHADDGFDLRARQFSAGDPLLEDPATGSANAALAGLLAHTDRSGRTAFRWRIAQGVEMGRPSVLEARAAKRDGRVEAVWIGGEVIGVTDGFLEV
ncbi:MAG: PhzF family phenazine biosynthesis protein [Gemmatimonadetes bacterium]|nr:PhzF family phenazine biosynthesis protein [Gemmatimonadota bacterium]